MNTKSTLTGQNLYELFYKGKKVKLSQVHFGDTFLMDHFGDVGLYMGINAWKYDPDGNMVSDPYAIVALNSGKQSYNMSSDEDVVLVNVEILPTKCNKDLGPEDVIRVRQIFPTQRWWADGRGVIHTKKDGQESVKTFCRTIVLREGITEWQYAVIRYAENGSFKEGIVMAKGRVQTIDPAGENND